MRQSKLTVFAIIFALATTAWAPATFSMPRLSFETSLGALPLRGGKCRAADFHGQRRAYLKLYRQVRHKFGPRRPGRNIVCDGVRAKGGGIRSARPEEVRKSAGVLDGMLHPPAASPPANFSSAGGFSSPALAAIRQCESGGNYSTNTGNGYYGAYQFTLSTWQSVGGTGNPAAASPAEQDRRAAILYRTAGAGQWPVCGR